MQDKTMSEKTLPCLILPSVGDVYRPAQRPLMGPLRIPNWP